MTNNELLFLVFRVQQRNFPGDQQPFENLVAFPPGTKERARITVLASKMNWGGGQWGGDECS